VSPEYKRLSGDRERLIELGLQIGMLLDQIINVLANFAQTMGEFVASLQEVEGE